MKTSTDFWQRVHLALDERRDPLEDGGVQGAIAQEPELLDELLRLRSRLDALPNLRGRRRVLRVAVTATIVIALGAIALQFLRTPSTTVKPVGSLAHSPDAPSASSPAVPLANSEILEFELSITTERPGERDTVVIDRAGTRRTREIGRDAFEHSTLTTEVLTLRGR